MLNADRRYLLESEAAGERLQRLQNRGLGSFRRGLTLCRLSATVLRKPRSKRSGKLPRGMFRGLVGWRWLLTGLAS
jgi:hypothetical protein